MRATIPRIVRDCKGALVPLSALERFVPFEQLVRIVGQRCHRVSRKRKLCLEAVPWLVVALAIYSDRNMQQVVESMGAYLTAFSVTADELKVSESAISQRRKALGAGPLAALFGAVCRPLATRSSPEAFLFGLSQMVIDGHVQNLPDTPANDRSFGRAKTDRGPAA